MMGLSAMSNVTPYPTAGDRVIHSVKDVVTSDTSDAVCRTVQLCLYQPTQGEVMYVCWLDLVTRHLITHLHNFIIHSFSFCFSPTHTPHSGLYQNPVSSVCEPCDIQCLGGCTNGTVRRSAAIKK